MKRKVVVFSIIVHLYGLLFWSLERWLSLEQLIIHELWLRRQVGEYPGRSCLLGFVIYLAASLIPGTGGKSVVFGWIFGLLIGATIVSVALTIAATISFCISRYFLRDMIQRRLGYFVARIDRALDHDGAFYLFALRVVHFPYALTNYAMGATTIRMRSFVCATAFGMLPGNVVFVYAGSQLPTLKTFVDEGIFGVLSPQLILAFTLVGISPIAIRALLRRFGIVHSPTKLS